MPAKKPDHYAVLGLAGDASDDAIRAAYKRLALQWHPDRHLKRKEHAAQMFIEVNTAYHALMDGKESTHSSSAETSSTTSVPASGTDTTRSDTNTKDTSRSSNRPPSASSETSSGSSPHPQKPPSTSSDSKSSRTAKPDSKCRTPPSNSSRGSAREEKSDSHSRSASADGQRSHSDRMKSGYKSSKSHDHLRDPPGATEKTSPSSTRSHSSEGLNGSSLPKSPKGDHHSSSPSSDARHGSRSQKTSHTAGVSHSSKPVIPPSSERLRKSSRFGLADEFVHKLSKGTAKGRKERRDNLPHDDDIPAYGSPLRAINAPRGSSKEWLFPLPLTLDEMYQGTTYRFLITRELLSRQTEQVEISIKIPPGIRNGTRIVCPRTGHQRKDGTLQDVVFLVEEVPDEKFSRVRDDLYMDVCVPWVDSLADQGGELSIEGMDGEEVTFTLPYPIYDKSTEGQVLVKGAGMPIRDGRKTVGRGDMIIRWQVVFSNQTKWQTFKKAFHIKV